MGPATVIGQGPDRPEPVCGGADHDRVRESCVGASTIGTTVKTLLRPHPVGWRPGPDPDSIRSFLRDLGYLSPEAGSATEIAEAVRLFQSAAGLEVDGVPTRTTVHALARAHRALLDLRALAA